MRTYYLEKMDKPKFSIRKYKIEEDNFAVYADLNKEKNVSKIIKVMIKNDIEYVVLSKTLTENKNFINALNANNIKIFNIWNFRIRNKSKRNKKRRNRDCNNDKWNNRFNNWNNKNTVKTV